VPQSKLSSHPAGALVWHAGAWVQSAQGRYVYSGNLVIQERASDNTPRITYTRGLDLSGSLEGAGGIGGLLARTDNLLPSSGSPWTHTFYHSDRMGNVTAMVNGAQKIVARYLYDPFGNTISKSGPLADANLYRYASKESHPLSGLIYFGRRFYHPNLQRWLNRDPIGEGGGVNLYRYGRNSPHMYLDAWGNDGQEPHTFQSISGPTGGGPTFFGQTIVYGNLYSPSLSPIDFRYNGSIGSHDSGGGGGYWHGVGQVFRGYGDAVWGIAEGLGNAIDHPILTLEGIGHAAVHPVQTGQAIWGSFGTGWDNLTGTDPRAAGQAMGNILIAAGSVALPFAGAAGAATETAAVVADAAPRFVNAETIQAALQDATLRTTQEAVSIPAVERYVRMLEAGSPAPPIKVVDGVIVDGNHTYMAGRVFGVEPPQAPGVLSPSQASQIKPIQQIKLDPLDWGNQ
jgi:RHS repeat-associated protein